MERTDPGSSVRFAAAAIVAASMALIANVAGLGRPRRAARQACATQLSRLSLALNNMSNGLVMVGQDGTIQLYNNRVLDLFGLPPGKLDVGVPLDQYLRDTGDICGWDEARKDRVVANHRAWMTLDTITRVEHHFDDGKVLSISCRPLPQGGAILTYDDVTEAREGQKKIAHMAFHDALTGLPNRRGFSERLAELSTKCSATLLMLDLDHFKMVNDTLGHAVGDTLLIEVARRLRGICHPTDQIFRLGGDELAVITDSEDGHDDQLAADMVASLAAPFQIGEHLVTIGCSIGLAVLEKDGDPQLVQQMADLALYRAKEKGRGRIETYQAGMLEEAADRRLLEIDLAEAIATQQFVLHYQPLYDLPGRSLSGFEALVRWNHPKRGMLPPNDFIPLAEQTGMIVEMGAWIIEEACRQAAQWPNHVSISINVSPVQLKSNDVLWQFTKAMDSHGITPGRIEIEVTETALVENSEQMAASLAGLRALGVRVAMDDFGTGYSSLAHLRVFELDRIKIDRSFINESHTDSGAAAVVRAVTSMARDLAISTTGEGVENEEQLANLVALGCETAQGFLLGKPLDAATATRLLASGADGRAVAALFAPDGNRIASLAHG